jgi:pimeloyl-ACP methyl ester carboxylesterase
VSWYEASAYARSVGKSLPSLYHWVRGCGYDLDEGLAVGLIIPQANFGADVLPVGSLTDVGVYGTVGLAGNVREWCANETDAGERFAVGGACGERPYMAASLGSASPMSRDQLLGFRCIKPLDQGAGPASAWQMVGRIAWPPPPRASELMEARTFEIVVKDRFAYDHSAPLEATREQFDEGDWIHAVAEINAAYRDAKGHWERIPVHLYLPKGVPGPQRYQAIVYFPGGEGEWRHRMPPLSLEHGLDRVVRSGRVLVKPVYRGTYERRYTEPAADLKAQEERRICLGQDFMRVIDYLQQRGDINMHALGYYGLSWGARIGASFVALDPRIRACVLEGGGLDNTSLRRDHLVLEWREYLPHIHVPVLMINGEADEIFPVRESQKPMFDLLLGAPARERYVYPGGRHVLPAEVKAARVFDWFDRHLGPPGRQP